MNTKSRRENLVIQDISGELLIYDLINDKIYSLNSTSAFVWDNLDGNISAGDLARRISKKFNQHVDEDLIWLAIDDLRKSNLLEEETAPKALSKIKRREMIKRVGLATMIALPIVSSLIAPTALNAASAGATAVCQPCTSSAQCAAPATCKPKYYGGTSLCAINSGPGTFGIGGDVGATSAANCATYAPKYCCRGTATFTAPSRCACS